MSESESPVEHTPTPSAHGSHGPVDPNQPVNPDFTDRDIHLDTVRTFMFGSLAVTVVFFVLMLAVHALYKKSFLEKRGLPEVRQIPRTDQAILQTKPLEGKLEYLELENSRLTVATNVGPHAVVPPEAAMRILLEEGAFPTPTPPPVAAAETLSSPLPPPEPVASPVVSVPSPPPASVQEEVVAPPAPALWDPAQVAAGKALWEAQCMLACHTGKKGAIAPNIQHAFGSMRKLEGGGEILMDEAYVVNSMRNPQQHIARGFLPIMTAFGDTLTPAQMKDIAAYLASQGTPIPVEKPVEPAPAPEPTVAPAAPAPAPAPEPTVAQAAPAPAPAPEPLPEPVPTVIPDVDPTPVPTPSYIFI